MCSFSVQLHWWSAESWLWYAGWRRATDHTLFASHKLFLCCTWIPQCYKLTECSSESESKDRDTDVSVSLLLANNHYEWFFFTSLYIFNILYMQLSIILWKSCKYSSYYYYATYLIILFIIIAELSGRQGKFCPSGRNCKKHS